MPTERTEAKPATGEWPAWEDSRWEGSGNVMALDVLRALRGADTAAIVARHTPPDP